MRKFVREGAMMLFGAALLLNLTGCCDDPNYDDVTPPDVPVASHMLTGMVTGIDGDAISGATVTMGSATAVTDFQGIYLIKDVKPGTHAIQVKAQGKRVKTGEVTMPDAQKTQVLIWNAVLAKDLKKEIPVSDTRGTEGDTETEALKGNDLAIVDIEVAVPAGAVTPSADGVELFIEPIYHADEAGTLARAASPTLMVGAVLSVNKAGVTLKNPVELGFNVGDEVAKEVEAKQYVNGQWVTVPSRIVNGRVVLDATEFTAYGLFLGVEFAASNSSEPLVFEQSEWSNLYGSQPLVVDDARFTYKVGTDISVRGTTVFVALLIEKLAQIYGVNLVSLNGVYPLDVTLPIGTALTVSGIQNKQQVSASALGRKASAVHYGTVTVAAASYNREHTGGSN